MTVDLDRLELSRGSICLDIGCGEGRHALASYQLPDVTVIGIDLSKKDLITAIERVTQMQDRKPEGSVNFLMGDATLLPIATDSIDVVIASEVMEHIPNYLLALEELTRVLKPGGRLCISVPRQWPEWVCWMLSDGYRSTSGGHIRIFDSKHLSREVERLGFILYLIRGAHALHVPYWWLRCIFWSWEKEPWIVRFYHRILVWDLFKRPVFTRFIDALLNPFMGKSIVLYFSKIPEAAPADSDN